MSAPVRLSRREVVQGSVMAFALTLPSGVFAQSCNGIPVVVQLSWGPGEDSAAPREQLIAAIANALAGPMGGTAPNWILVDA